MKLWAVFSVILIVVTSWLWPSDKGFAQQREPCFPNLIKMDMCSEAKRLQAALALALPQTISANVTMFGAVADGTTVSLLARWNFSREQIIESTHAANITIDALISKMTESEHNSVCSDKRLASFVRLGGKIAYIYNTKDGFRFTTITVSDCPPP